jgi:hypothetical protein
MTFHVYLTIRSELGFRFGYHLLTLEPLRTIIFVSCTPGTIGHFK